MKGTTHVFGGAAAAVGVALLAPVETRPLIVLTGAVAALLPDIDHPYSMLGRYFPWPKISKISGSFTAWGRRGLFGPVWHRGQTHSFFGGIIAATLFTLLLQLIVPLPPYLPFLLAAIVVGYWSHLLLDMLSPSKQMLFWPFSKDLVRPNIPGYSQRSFFGKLLELATVGVSLLVVLSVANSLSF